MAGKFVIKKSAIGGVTRRAAGLLVMASLAGCGSLAPSSLPSGTSPAPTATVNSSPTGSSSLPGSFNPNLIAVDPSGAVVVTDCDAARVYRIKAGAITTIAGSGPGGFEASFVGDGGPATEAQLQCPYGVAFDAAGNLFVADHGNQRVRVVERSGVIRTVAGSGPHGDKTGSFAGDGGPATAARLNEPTWLTFDRAGNLYITDRDNNRVRKVTPAGVITTVAGNGTAGFSGDGGPATRASLDGPAGLAVDRAGDLYIADSNNRRIRVVRPNGRIETYAGTGADGSAGDGGPARAASFNDPEGLAIDRVGDLYVGDDGANRVRRISPNGTISAFAGTGAAGYTGDGGSALAATLQGAGSPLGIAVSADGVVIVADTGNHCLRAIAHDGTIKTLTR